MLKLPFMFFNFSFKYIFHKLFMNSLVVLERFYYWIQEMILNTQVWVHKLVLHLICQYISCSFIVIKSNLASLPLQSASFWFSDEIGKFGQSALQLLGCLRIGALPSLLNSAGILSTYDDTESLLRTRAPTQLSLAAPSHNS